MKGKEDMVHRTTEAASAPIGHPAAEDDAAAKMRADTIEECLRAARAGFDAAMENYVLIGPSGMAMQMINSIKALKAIQPSKETPIT